jgi:hypothetical protein
MYTNIGVLNTWGLFPKNEECKKVLLYSNKILVDFHENM